MSKVTPTARYLEYMLDGETFSINGDAYEGFTRIWKILLSGRKQVNGGLPWELPNCLLLLNTLSRCGCGQGPSIFWSHR